MNFNKIVSFYGQYQMIPISVGSLIITNIPLKNVSQFLKRGNNSNIKLSNLYLCLNNCQNMQWDKTVYFRKMYNLFFFGYQTNKFLLPSFSLQSRMGNKYLHFVYVQIKKNIYTHNVLKCFQLNINEALQKMTDPSIFFYLL